MHISRNVSIEELVEKVPASVKYLMEQGIKCIACGEPIWGTLEQAARDKGFRDADIDRFVNEINQLPLEQTASTEKKIRAGRLDTGEEDKGS